MSRMRSPLIQYKHEHYFCSRCQKEIPADAVSSSWQCGFCSVPVFIYAEDGKCRRHTLRRFPVSEIEKDWNVVVPNGGFDYIYQVIAKRRDGEFCELALKGYKKLRYEADFIIESIEGTWDRS